MNFDFFKKIDTFSEDGRKPISDIYKPFVELAKTDRWGLEVLNSFKEAPVIAAVTNKNGPAIYLTSGVHGEEPTGPNALAENADFLGELANKDYAIIVYPLINPVGYIKDWRYPNSRRGPSKEELAKNPEDRSPEARYMTFDNRKGFYSAADTSHLIMDTSSLPKIKPMLDTALTSDTRALTKSMVDLFRVNPPLMHIDFHEDEELKHPYVYTAGRLKMNYDPVARGIIEIMKRHGLKFPQFQRTRFGDLIVNGYGVSSPEGNLADLFSDQVLFIDGKPTIRAPAKSAVTIEMPTKGMPLTKRVEIYSDIIRNVVNLRHALMGSPSVSDYY